MKYLAIISFLVVFWTIDSTGYTIDVSIAHQGNKLKVFIEYCNLDFVIITDNLDDDKKIRCNILKELEKFKKRGIMSCSVPKCED